MKLLVKLLSIVGLGVLVLLSSSCSQIKFKTEKVGDVYYTGYGDYEFRKRVVVVDSGLDTKLLKDDYMCRDFAHLSYEKSLEPSHAHGTMMVNIINKDMNKKKYCITMLKLRSLKEGSYYLNEEFNYLAYNIDADIISLSMEMRSYSLYFHKSLSTIVRDSGTRVNVAAGNSGINLDTACIIYAACYASILRREGINTRNLKVIGAMAEYSNHGSVVDLFLQVGDEVTNGIAGTSAATALYTNMLVRD